MPEKNIKRFMYAPEAAVRVVAGDLYSKAISIGLVCDVKGKLLGIVTLSDLKQALMRGADPEAPLASVMNRDFVSALKGTPHKELERLASRKNALGTGKLRRIPLVDKMGKLAGLFALSGSDGMVPPTVLVTGGAGYIGSHLSRLLLKDGYRVVVLDKLLFGDQGIADLRKHKNFTHVHGDIGDIGTLVSAVPQADYVVHLAGIVGDPASALNPVQTMEENHFSTKMLIELCRHYQVSRFVFASSCSVYGASEQELNEKSQLNPVSLYAQSKLYSERELLAAAGKHFHPVILRFGTVYGLSPRMRFDLVVNTMSAHAHFNKKITVDGGEQWRPLLHVEDAARACVAALKAPLSKVSAQIFNVGDSKENYRIKDIAAHVKRHVPKARVEQLDTVKDRRDYRVSFKKINKVLGFATKHKMPPKIGEIVQQFKKGKLKNWGDKRYSNYLTLRSELEKGLE